MVSGGGGCTPPPPSTTTTRKGTTSAAALASPSSTRSSSLPSTWPLRHHVHQLHHSHHLKQPLHREPAGCLAHQHDSCHGRRLGVHDEALPAPATPPARQAAERASRHSRLHVGNRRPRGLPLHSAACTHTNHLVKPLQQPDRTDPTECAVHGVALEAQHVASRPVREPAGIWRERAPGWWVAAAHERSRGWSAF